MTNNSYTHFVQFVESERAYYQTERLIERVTQELKSLVDALAKQAHLLDDIKAKVSTLKLKVHEYELDIKDKRSRKTQLQSRLEKVSNPKEYTAMSKEMEDVGRAEDLLEEQLFETWQQYEAEQLNFEKCREEFEAFKSAQQENINERKKNLHALEQDLVILAEQRSELEKNVNPELLEDFYNAKRSVNDPYVPLEDNHCSACRCQISMSDLLLIRKHVFVMCQQCYRKLYAPLR